MPDAWRALGRRPLALSCLGAALLGLTGVLFQLSGTSPATGAFFRCLYALPVLWLLARYERRATGDGDPTTHARPLAWAAGVVLGADLVVWQRSVIDVGAGLATVLGNTQLVFVVLASAVLFGERVTGRLAIAIGTMLAGVVLISGALEQHPYGADPARGVVFGIAAGALYAAYIMLVRRAGGGRPTVGPLVDATAAAALTAALLGAALGELDLTPSWSAQGWLLLTALVGQVLGWVLLTVPSGRLPASATSMALTLQPVSGVLYGMALLSERPSALQLAGVLVVVGGFLAAVRSRAPAPQPTSQPPPARPAAPTPDRYPRTHA
jgi:drug/metabolite transporter (DMT)-like permease